MISPGIVFTSQTAVEACVRSLSQGDGSSMAEDWETLPVFVVGKATAKAGMLPTRIVIVMSGCCLYTVDQKCAFFFQLRG